MTHEIEITPKDLKVMLDAHAPGLILLDVREAWEFATCKIPDSLRLGDLGLKDLLPRLKTAADVITICHHGVRSFSAAMYLRDQGVAGARSLAGGVEAWAEAVDPAMARY